MTDDNLLDRGPLIDPEEDDDDELGESSFHGNPDDHFGNIGGAATDEFEEMIEKQVNRRNVQNDPELSSERLERQPQIQLRFNVTSDNLTLDPKVIEDQELIRSSHATSKLEIALYDELERKQNQIERLIAEISKLKEFVSKRKQVYKRSE